MCILYASKVLINKVKCLISEVDRQACASIHYHAHYVFLMLVHTY